jgi:hypothetical protein
MGTRAAAKGLIWQVFFDHPARGAPMARYDQVRFLTTHNSYSGGLRGSLTKQLGARVRYVELDFHDNGWSDIRDFRIGHLKPGMEVALANGNPTTLLLHDWLSSVIAWSAANPGHGPITVVLDCKDDLTDGQQGGDLEDLNRILAATFANKLFTRDEYDRNGGVWPDVRTLRDRCLCVLSGHGGSRMAYRWSFGSAPAVASNAEGNIALVYCSSSGDINCWTGKADAAATGVHWVRKFTYSVSNLGLSDPAIGVTDGGWVVSVHHFSRPNLPDRLESRVGRIQDDVNNEGRIKWFSDEIIGVGLSPSIRIVGDEVVEIHTTSDGKRRQQLKGTLNRRSRKVEWEKARATQAQAFAKDETPWQTHRIKCAIDPAGWIGCMIDGGALAPTRFQQLAFVELQKGEDATTMRDALFFAADAKARAAIKQARDQGLVARAWGFENGDQTAPWVENMPATDAPAEPWYQDYMVGPDVAS